MGRAIFISYRRDDSEGEAGRLFDDLARTFGENSVFMDVTDIKPGFDFRKAIDDNVATCGVLLAMIGPSWATIANGTGERRLDDPSDFVRLEIASALAREIAVIPVLVHGAQMPHPDQLPENLKDFAFRNSVELTHVRWNTDVQLLINALRQYVASPGKTSDEPVHATVTVQLPPANPPAHEPAPTKSSKMPLIAGIAVAAVLAIAAIGFLIFHSSSAANGPGTGGVTNPPPATTAASVAATPNPLVGTWTNPTPEADNGLNRMEVSAAGNQLSIHAWGQCQPVNCDWGVQTAALDGESATASWSFIPTADGKKKDRVANVTIKPENGGISVAIVNTFKKRAPTERQFNFVRAQ